jgi:acyl carrier protein
MVVLSNIRATGGHLMNRDEVVKRVNEFIKEKFSLDLEGNIIKEYSLLDPRVGLTPRDLLVLFMEMQRIFGIRFVEQDVIEKRFDYLDNIVDAIMMKVVVS